MDNKGLFWGRLSRLDAVVSLVMGGFTLWTGELDALPWAVRIVLALLAACSSLWLWRYLTMRRFRAPHIIQPLYENDVLDLAELFGGRSFIRGVTFRNTEIRGPGSIALLAPIMRGNSFNPSLDSLLVVVPGETSLFPHYQFRDCVFEGCMFTGCGLIAIPEFADWLLESCGSPRRYVQVAPPAEPDVQKGGHFEGPMREQTGA